MFWWVAHPCWRGSHRSRAGFAAEHVAGAGTALAGARRSAGKSLTCLAPARTWTSPGCFFAPGPLFVVHRSPELREALRRLGEQMVRMATAWWVLDGTGKACRRPAGRLSPSHRWRREQSRSVCCFIGFVNLSYGPKGPLQSTTGFRNKLLPLSACEPTIPVFAGYGGQG